MTGCYRSMVCVFPRRLSCRSRPLPHYVPRLFATHEQCTRMPLKLNAKHTVSHPKQSSFHTRPTPTENVSDLERIEKAAVTILRWKCANAVFTHHTEYEWKKTFKYSLTEYLNVFHCQILSSGCSFLNFSFKNTARKIPTEFSVDAQISLNFFSRKRDFFWTCLSKYPSWNLHAQFRLLSHEHGETFKTQGMCNFFLACQLTWCLFFKTWKFNKNQTSGVLTRVKRNVKNY